MDLHAAFTWPILPGVCSLRSQRLPLPIIIPGELYLSCPEHEHLKTQSEGCDGKDKDLGKDMAPLFFPFPSQGSTGQKTMKNVHVGAMRFVASLPSRQMFSLIIS